MHTRSSSIYTTPSSTSLPSSASTTAARPPLKRPRSDAPSIVMISASKRARDEFFDALVANNADSPNATITRTISSADDLEKWELRRCFDLLHACGRATQPDATLSTTRKSIEGFLEAIFNGWAAGGGTSEELIKPLLDVQVDAEVVAGKVCGK